MHYVAVWIRYDIDTRDTIFAQNIQDTGLFDRYITYFKQPSTFLLTHKCNQNK